MNPLYEKRLRRVIRYMHDNPDGDLSLDRLSDVAAMSRFHWHRVFQAMTGETCAQAARRIRLYRAGHMLVQTKLPVSRIAADVGYDNTDSFARAFRDAYGLTPAAFRKAGRPCASPITIQIGDDDMYPVTIRPQNALRLASLTHRGAYTEISDAFGQLAAVFSSRGLWAQSRGMAGVYFDDPSTVAVADLRSAAGIIVGPEFEMPEDLEELVLPAGDHAILTLEGPYTGLPNAYQYLYGPWLQESGREPADAPSFEIYLNDPTDTAPADLRTEVCLPLAA